MIFRLKVFLPFLLLVALASFIFIYRIDGWVRDGLEDAISLVSGTKTDIHSLRLSFRESSLHIKRLEIASSEQEFQNLIEFEDIRVDFQFLPILKKRAVIDEFSIRGVKWGTERTTSGKLPPRVKSKEPSWFSELSNAAVIEAKKEFQKMPVHQLTDFRIPDSPREALDRLELKSEEAYKKVAVSAQELRGSWTGRVQDLKDVSRYENWIREARQLLKVTPNDAQSLLTAAETVQKTIRLFEDERARVASLVTKVETDFNTLQALTKTAADALQSDYDRARKMVSFEDLSLKNMSKLLFGERWLHRVDEVLRYRELLRRLIAAGSSEDGIQVRPRAQGRDIVFITPRKEPDFILAQSEFSVEGIEGGDRRNVNQVYKLKLEHLNSAPKLYGKPSRVLLEASLRDFLFQRAAFEGFWDYTQPIAKDRYELKVERLKTKDWFMGIPKIFPLKLSSGEATVVTDLQFTGDDFSWKSQVAFKDTIWDTSEIPKVGLLIQLLEETFASISQFRVTFQMGQKASQMDYSISSDLDQIVQASLERSLQKRVQEFEERLKRELNLQIARAEERALQEVDGFKAEALDQVARVRQTLDSYVNEASSVERQLKAKAEHLAKQKVQQELQELPIPDAGGLLKKVKPSF